MLNIIDEFTHECLRSRVSRRLNRIDVIDALADLFMLRDVPAAHPIRQRPRVHCESREGLDRQPSAHSTAYIARGSPWENGYRRELQWAPARRAARWEISTSLREAQIVIETAGAALQWSFGRKPPTAISHHCPYAGVPALAAGRLRTPPVHAVARSVSGATEPPYVSSQRGHARGPYPLPHFPERRVPVRSDGHAHAHQGNPPWHRPGPNSFLAGAAPLAARRGFAAMTLGRLAWAIVGRRQGPANQQQRN